MPRKFIDMEMLKQAHAAGMTVPEMVGKLGFGILSIYAALKRAGLKPHKAPKGRPARASINPCKSAKRSEIASAGGNFQRRPKPGAAGPPGSAVTTTLHLSAAGLDRLWAALSLEFKADCINHILATEG